MNASTPFKNVLVVPKNVAKKYGLLNSDESLKTAPSDLPLPLKPVVASLEKLLSNRQKPLNVPPNLKVHSATEDIPGRSHLNGMTTSILPNKQDTTNNFQVKSTSEIVKKQKVDGTNKVYTSTGKTNLVCQGSRVSSSSNSLQNEQKPILIRPSQSFSLLRPEVRNNNSLLKLNARSPNSLLRPSISNVSQLNVVNTPRKSNVYQLNDVNMPGKSSVSQLNIVKVSQKPIVSPSNAVNGPQTPNFLKYKILKPGNAKVVMIVNATSSSQSFCENNAVSKHNLIQEHAVSSNSMLKSGSLSVPMKNITPNLPNDVQKQTVTPLELIPSKCSTPNSFIRPNLSSGPKVLCANKEEINKTSEFQITSNISEDQTDLNDLIATKNIVTLNELTEAICFPKTSIPSRPILSNTCKSEKKDINASYLDCGSSCSSPHYDSERLYLGRVQVQRKHLLGGSDLLSSTVNDQILYYIQQLRCLVNTCTFLETESAVRWLVRGLPLVHSDAQMVAYKTVHPYCAYSRQVYCSWSPTRQAAAEWLRAKTVVRLLTLLQTKQVLTELV
ncbi:uncharacterized protein LOC128992610 [Macrosteles quadrilineatus]|uniref:uncharacterized protein LOC128992610 n=1 Tax=Macrosteles quadrilineatus TaxID=74068 RepID=UPI0023E14F4C|nr:uncharacterized protein LOC128992610 [Macrosteles quadrilineatus]